MRIEHLAIWTRDLERMKVFYEKYFGAAAGPKYHNPDKKFESYFLTFDGGARLELMTQPGIPVTGSQDLGLAHFAMAVGSKQEVNRLTEQLRSNGFIISGEPRITGDGYYESVVLDPDGNRVEITI